jgi:hypothetical protein
MTIKKHRIELRRTHQSALSTDTVLPIHVTYEAGSDAIGDAVERGLVPPSKKSTR